MPPDGSCPTCGAVIAEVADSRVPWHFWALIVALVVYLGWRLVQLFQWLITEGHTAIAAGLGALVAALAIGGAWWNWRPDDADEHETSTP